MAVARAAIDARDFDRARDVLTPVLTQRPTQAALFVMANLVESETGDQGRARDWMARAVRAPRDPAWTVDGMILEHWAPASPVTGRIDTVEWKVPVAELEGPHLRIDAEDLKPAVLSLPVIDVDDSEMDETMAEPVVITSSEPDRPPTGAAGPQTAGDGQDGESRTVQAIPASGALPVASADAAPEARPAPSADEAAPPLHIVPPAEPEADPGVKLATPPHMPDDPGVADEDVPTEKPRRFRIL